MDTLYVTIYVTNIIYVTIKVMSVIWSLGIGVFPPVVNLPDQPNLWWMSEPKIDPYSKTAPLARGCSLFMKHIAMP